MAPLDKPCLTRTELRSRRWTNTLIDRFLPVPDGHAPVNHWLNFRGQDAFAAVKIWNVEQSDDFAVAFLKACKGRMRGRSAEQALAELRNCPPPVTPVRSREEVVFMTGIAAAGAALDEARSRGHETPHK